MLSPHRFHPRLLDDWRDYSRSRFLADLAAGLTVGVVALPLALAFGIASGVTPEQGLATAIVAGLLISLLGGSSVQIGGPAGAFIVVVYGIVQRHGVAGLLVATLMAGALQLLLGALRLGVLVRYIPVAIVIGFTNAIAVLIGLSQIKDLLGLSALHLPAGFFPQIQALASHVRDCNPAALAVGVGSAALVLLWSRLPVRLQRLPGSLAALIAATLAVRFGHLEVETIGSRFGGIPQHLPWPELPLMSWTGLQQLLMPALTIALLGAIESLLCARVADQAGTRPRHDPNQELMAQGLANLAAPLFAGIPATGTIARTLTNVRAGASSPVAGIVHALTLLLIVLVAAPLAADVPLAALAGILLVVASHMGEWHEFARLRHFSLQYRTILLGSFALTVMVDLTVAVEVGLVLACAFFIHRMSTLFSIQPLPSPRAGVELRALYGALFFGAVGKIEGLAEGLPEDCRTLVLDLHQLISMDTSGLDALTQLHRSLARQQRELVLCGLNAQPASLLRRGGLEALLGPGAVRTSVEDWLAS
jgi:SulP family sulfate permease